MLAADEQSSMTLREPAERPVPASCGIPLFAAALRGAPCEMVDVNDGRFAVPVHRWTQDADESDHAVLDRCHGATIDVGCGPGRMTLALAARGSTALGFDIEPLAVTLALDRGAEAVVADVFGAGIPGAGRWDSALLADGNIGIGGDPVRLLRRVHQLVRGYGRIIVDLAEPGTGMTVHVLRLRVDDSYSVPFRWAFLAPEALPEVVEAAGLKVHAVHEHDGRWFADLRKNRPGMAMRSPS